MTPEVETVLTAIATAVACALPGVYLVLRRAALVSDAISHTLLVGIVLAFLITRDLESPWLIVGAGLTGVVTVSLVELLQKTDLVREDAAIGLVFPLLFSIGMVLVNLHAGGIHLDVDAVLLGELAFANLRRSTIAGISIPTSLGVMVLMLLVNIAFVGVLYKELKLSTFDAALASTLGFAPWLLHYALMTLVSVTAVAAFDAVGSILVVALMIGPAATAYLVTHRLLFMLLLSAAIAALNATVGCVVAFWLDANLAGAIATTTGLAFALVYGGLTLLEMRQRQLMFWDFAQTMLVVHLFQHEGTPNAQSECRAEHLQEHLRWKEGFGRRVVSLASGAGLVEAGNNPLRLTAQGRNRARQRLGVATDS